MDIFLNVTNGIPPFYNLDYYRGLGNIKLENMVTPKKQCENKIHCKILNLVQIFIVLLIPVKNKILMLKVIKYIN